MRRRFSTGLYALDALADGGIVAGLTEIVGKDASGKSSLAYAMAREAEAAGEAVTLIQAKGHAWPEYVIAAGPSDCAYVNAPTGEVMIEAAYSAVRAGCKLIIIDALPAVLPAAVIKSSLADTSYGSQYRMLRHGMTALRFEAFSSGAALVVVNELRWNGYSGLDSFCAKVLDDIADNRIETKRIGFSTEYGTLSETSVSVELRTRAHRPCDAKVRATITPTHGFDFGLDMLAALEYLGHLTRRGNWWYDPECDVSFGPGFSAAADSIREYGEYYRLIWRKHAETYCSDRPRGKSGG